MGYSRMWLICSCGVLRNKKVVKKRTEINDKIGEFAVIGFSVNVITRLISCEKCCEQRHLFMEDLQCY